MAAPSQLRYFQARLKLHTLGMMSRLLDLLVSLPCILLASPFWLFYAISLWVRGRRWLHHQPLLGLGGKTIYIPVCNEVGPGPLSRFFNHTLLRRSPVILSVFMGDLSLVGPAPMAMEAGGAMPTRYLRRLDAKPGLIHTYFLRSSLNIAFEDERELALVDAERHGLKSRIGMLVRAAPAFLFRSTADSGSVDGEVMLFGLKFRNRTMEEAVGEILDAAESEQGARVAFVNPDCINIALKDSRYRAVLEKTDAVYPDGIGLQIACKMLGMRMKDNLNGTDLFPILWNRMQDRNMGVYLLGSYPGVAEKMAGNLKRSYPKLKISGYRHGYFSKRECDEIVEEINASGAHLLLVAMGVPRQEIWIDRFRPRLNVKVVAGVGGLFDFVSGRIPRAPVWIREMGLEWCYRLLREPRRLWRRYIIGNLIFFWNLLRMGK